MEYWVHWCSSLLKNNMVENALLKLIESLQKKQTDDKWEDNFHSK